MCESKDTVRTDVKHLYELLTKAIPCSFSQECSVRIIDCIVKGKCNAAYATMREVTSQEYHKYNTPVLLFEADNLIRFAYCNASERMPLFVKKHINAFTLTNSPKLVHIQILLSRLEQLLSYTNNSYDHEDSITIDENFRKRAIENLLQCKIKLGTAVQNVLSLQEGTTLNNGRYVIKKVLGNGGFAITYLATDNAESGKEVAIKELFMQDVCQRNPLTFDIETPNNKTDKELLTVATAKFIGEAEKIKDAAHPNIIKVFDTFEEHNTYYYTMEYMPGGSLDSLLSQGCIDEETAVRYIKGVAHGLTKMHSMNMLHLDIKPANIMIGNDGEVVIIDFGSTKRYDSIGIACTGNPLVLSNRFAAPELFTNESARRFSPKADVYSLGVTLFVMLTRKLPVDFRRMMGISNNLRTVIRTATAARVENRLGSIEEFVRMLDK